MSTKQLTQAISCPNCSGSLDLNPEDVIAVCPFCGTAFTRGQQNIGSHLLVPKTISKRDAETRIGTWMRAKTRFRGVGLLQIVALKAMFIPFWVVSSHAESRYRGYRRETRTKSTGSGKNRRTESITVYKPIEGQIDEHRRDPLMCRLTSRFFGNKRLLGDVRRLVSTEDTLVDFSTDHLLDQVDDLEFLSGELTSSEAKETVETYIQDEHRQRARDGTTELFDCRTAIRIEQIAFVHIPVILAEYVYKKETYRVLMSGHDQSVLAAEIPITTRLRVIATAITAILVLVTLGLAFLITIREDLLIYYLGLSVLLFLAALKSNATAWSVESRYG